MVVVQVMVETTISVLGQMKLVGAVVAAWLAVLVTLQEQMPMVAVLGLWLGTVMRLMAQLIPVAVAAAVVTILKTVQAVQVS